METEKKVRFFSWKRFKRFGIGFVIGFICILFCAKEGADPWIISYVGAGFGTLIGIQFGAEI
jgi:hypothetical protein